MRILHVLSTMNIGSGIANFAMNYYRSIVKITGGGCNLTS